MTYEITLGNHPSQARHPVTNEPLTDKAGQPVPLFPDQASVKLDGFVIAYVSCNNNVQFLAPFSRLPQQLRDEVVALVENERGPIGKVSAPADVPLPVQESNIWTGE
jgi:hypothetical protein